MSGEVVMAIPGGVAQLFGFPPMNAHLARPKKGNTKGKGSGCVDLTE